MSRVYCQFYDGDTEAGGSDGVYILDGRNKIETMVNDCYERMDKLKHVKPWYNGFKIMRTASSRLFDNPQVIYSNIKR